MDFNEYQKAAMETAVYPNEIKKFDQEDTELLRVSYTIFGLVGEAGEIAQKLKKLLRDKRGFVSQEFRHQISLELGDVLWYCAALATELGLNLDDVVQSNLNKLCRRKEAGTIQGEGDHR